ncbi:Vacuolar protein sorting-associated protein 13C [Thelohanellus kitauei]|uniref:Vacuolar protein sorting-associated protein 13C n=1 Tax=Thelohanellus kitauei TaxID=669202 RepID=A0A0C2MKV5_THEKT|nr:Vacuolar protein sorting-associated protein 13C [Thelohanellus kitauei]
MINLESQGYNKAIQYRSLVNKNIILFSPGHSLYFSGICHWINDILTIEFRHLKAEMFDSVCINFSSAVVQCYNKIDFYRLSPRQQVFFSSCYSHDKNLHKVECNEVLCSNSSILCFSNIIDKITKIEGGMNLWVAKYIDANHIVYAITEDYNFAKYCSSTINERTRLNIDVKISGLSLSLVSCALSSELLLLSVFKNCNRWYVGSDESQLTLASLSFCKKMDSLYLRYLLEGAPIANIDNKRRVNFRSFTMVDDGIRFPLKLKSNFGIKFLFNISTSKEIQNVSVSVDKIQIDSPAYDHTNQVILSQTVFPPSVTGSDETEIKFLVASLFMNMSSNPRRKGDSKFKCIDYLKVLVQEFDIFLDVKLMLTLAKYFDQIMYLFGKDDQFNDTRVEYDEEEHEMFKYSLKYFHLSPLKFNITITSASIHDKTTKHLNSVDSNFDSFRGLITLILIHFPLMDISKTSISLPCLEFEDCAKLVTMTELLERSKHHYYSHMKKNLVKLMFNLKVTGNIVSSASQFARGMKSFVYEPYKGVVRSNQFGKGVLIGFKGLYSGTIGNAANVLTSISDSIGKGLASLTFDSDHEATRQDILKIREENPVKGFMMSGLGVFRGFGSGVTGLIKTPIQAFQETKEVSGVFKGIGKGISGLIAKPIGGIVDFTSSGFNLISTAGEKPRIVRPRREERCFYFDEIIRLIDFEEIKKYDLFKRIRKKFKTLSRDQYFYGEFNNNQFILITDRHISVTVPDDVFGSSLLYCFELVSIVQCRYTGDLVEIRLDEKSESEKGKLKNLYIIKMPSDQSASIFANCLSRLICS